MAKKGRPKSLKDAQELEDIFEHTKPTQKRIQDLNIT